MLQFELPVVAFRLGCSYIHPTALPELEPVTLLQLSVSGADCVRMQPKSACEFPGAGQSLTGSQFTADNGQHDLCRQLLPNSDIALPREPELHGRSSYDKARVIDRVIGRSD